MSRYTHNVVRTYPEVRRRVLVVLTSVSAAVLHVIGKNPRRETTARTRAIYEPPPLFVDRFEFSK